MATITVKIKKGENLIERMQELGERLFNSWIFLDKGCMEYILDLEKKEIFHIDSDIGQEKSNTVKKGTIVTMKQTSNARCIICMNIQNLNFNRFQGVPWNLYFFEQQTEEYIPGDPTMEIKVPEDKEILDFMKDNGFGFVCSNILFTPGCYEKILESPSFLLATNLPDITVINFNNFNFDKTRWTMVLSYQSEKELWDLLQLNVSSIFFKDKMPWVKEICLFKLESEKN